MSGPSGKHKAPGFILRGLSPEELAEVDRAARAACMTRTAWTLACVRKGLAEVVQPVRGTG